MHDSNPRAQQDDFRSPRQDRSCTESLTSTPTAEPWYDDAEDLSPRASKYFSDLFTAQYTARESGDTVPPHDQNTAAPSPEARTASAVTLFPHIVASGLVPKGADIAKSKYSALLNPAAQKQSFFKKHYRRLKEIHDNGPPGKGQMFVTSMKRYFRYKEAVVAFEICSPRRKDEENPRPSSGFAGHQPGTGQSLRQPPLIHSTIDGGKPRTRRDSAASYGNISCTSCEVPVKIRRTVLEMNINKPLRPPPPLNTTPKQRSQNENGKAMNTSKPLPRTPLDCSSGTQEHPRETLMESPVDALWPSTHTETVGLEALPHQPAVSHEYTENCSQRAERMVQRTWLDDFTDTSNPHLPLNGKSKPSKAERTHDALKAKISRPITIPRTVNKYPPYLLSHPEAVRGKAKGKQKEKLSSSPAWLNKLAHPTLPTMPTMPAIYKPKKRPESDKSFICQGLGEDNVYAQIIMGGGALSANDGRQVVSAGKTFKEELMPAPLFAGRKSHESHYDVDDAKVDQRRTGRWI